MLSIPELGPSLAHASRNYVLGCVREDMRVRKAVGCLYEVISYTPSGNASYLLAWISRQ